MPARGEAGFQAIHRAPAKRVEQGAAPVAAAGVDHQTGRLVDHDQMLILEHDIERYRFRHVGQVGCAGNGRHRDRLAAHEFVLGIEDSTRRLKQLTRPSRIQSCKRLRECSGIILASAASKRRPAKSIGTTISTLGGSALPL